MNILTIHNKPQDCPEEDMIDNYLFNDIKNTLKMVAGDLKDRYHFDTDEPYLTPQGLAWLIAKMEEELLNNGVFVDGEVEYILERDAQPQD